MCFVARSTLFFLYGFSLPIATDGFSIFGWFFFIYDRDEFFFTYSLYVTYDYFRFAIVLFFANRRSLDQTSRSENFSSFLASALICRCLRDFLRVHFRVYSFAWNNFILRIRSMFARHVRENSVFRYNDSIRKCGLVPNFLISVRISNAAASHSVRVGLVVYLCRRRRIKIQPTNDE